MNNRFNIELEYIRGTVYINKHQANKNIQKYYSIYKTYITTFFSTLTTKLVYIYVIAIIIMSDSIRSLGGKLKTDVDEQLLQDIQLLNKFSETDLISFVSIIVTWIIAPGSSNLMESMGNFVKSSNSSAKLVKATTRGLLILLKGTLRYNVSPTQLGTDLETLGLASERKGAVAQIWQKNYASLSRAAITKTLSMNELVNMEWKFGVTASSNDLESVGNTFLQLKLVINKGGHGGDKDDKDDSNNNNNKEVVYMELTLPQFYNFLAEMEKAKSTIDFFTG